MAKSAKARARRAKRRHDVNPHTFANPERAQAMADLRSSGAAGTHVQGQRGQRTRQGAKEAAIRDSRSW